MEIFKDRRFVVFFFLQLLPGCDVQLQVRLTEERRRERLPAAETGSLTQHLNTKDREGLRRERELL